MHGDAGTEARRRRARASAEQGTRSAVAAYDTGGRCVQDLSAFSQTGRRVQVRMGLQRSGAVPWWVAARWRVDVGRHRGAASEGLILPKSKPPSDQSGRGHHLHRRHAPATLTRRRSRRSSRRSATRSSTEPTVGMISTGYSSISIDTPTTTASPVRRGHRKGHGRGPDATGHSDGGRHGRRPDRGALSGARRVLDGLRPARTGIKITNRRKAFIYVSQATFVQSIRTPATKEQNAASRGSVSTTLRRRLDQPEFELCSNCSDSSDPFKRPGAEFAEADLIGELPS